MLIHHMMNILLLKKLRREAKIISSILDKHGKKKLQEIDRNCMSTIDSRGINFKVYSADKKAAEEKNGSQI